MLLFLNINEDINVLVDLLQNNPPDVVFNLIEFFREDSLSSI